MVLFGYGGFENNKFMRAIGVLDFYNTAAAPVFIAFQADGVTIPGCEKQLINQASTIDESRYEATCVTVALKPGTNRITASFSGDNYNFPAITDTNVMPTPVLLPPTL